MSTLTLLPPQPRVRRSNSLCLPSFLYFGRRPSSQRCQVSECGNDTLDGPRDSTSRLGMYRTSHPSSTASSHKSSFIDESDLLQSNQYETEEEEEEEIDNNESIRNIELMMMPNVPVTRRHSLGATPLPVMRANSPPCDLSVAQKESCFEK